MAKIVKIERENYRGLVYGIDVEGDESFVANGLVVHNCADGVNQGARFDIIKSNDVVLENTKAFEDSLDLVVSPDFLTLANSDLVYLEESYFGKTIVIDADRANTITDVLELQLRKSVPESIPIEVRSVPFAEWKSLASISEQPVKKSKNQIGFLTAGVGDSRINLENMRSMDNHWLYKGGYDMTKKTSLEKLADWVGNEKLRRTKHRKQLDELGFPPDKDFEEAQSDHDDKNEKEPRKIKSGKGYDQKSVQRPSSG